MHTYYQLGTFSTVLSSPTPKRPCAADDLIKIYALVQGCPKPLDNIHPTPFHFTAAINLRLGIPPFVLKFTGKAETYQYPNSFNGGSVGRYDSEVWRSGNSDSEVEFRWMTATPNLQCGGHPVGLCHLISPYGILLRIGRGITAPHSVLLTQRSYSSRQYACEALLSALRYLTHPSIRFCALLASGSCSHEESGMMSPLIHVQNYPSEWQYLALLRSVCTITPPGCGFGNSSISMTPLREEGAEEGD